MVVAGTGIVGCKKFDVNKKGRLNFLQICCEKLPIWEPFFGVAE
jgi:hypothetical protein